MPTLGDLRQGQKARIESVAGGDALSQRLMEMGLLEGEIVEVIAFAPLGDPMEVRLPSSRLSLRRADARRVQVALID
jgi:Fe2+ transport system protein FeoA